MDKRTELHGIVKETGVLASNFPHSDEPDICLRNKSLCSPLRALVWIFGRVMNNVARILIAQTATSHLKLKRNWSTSIFVNIYMQSLIRKGKNKLTFLVL